MANRYLVIHGHFYQPPRENPWCLAIEPQESAAPFDNWNSRIDRECYGPNGRSRLLDRQGAIAKLINNYQYLSFNFGPTLLSWLEKADPDTYALIIEADKKAAKERGGHGPALAQVYNHVIMPLASARDKLTQIRWGARDFRRRFGRAPEGMWLAETAVDLETLRLLRGEGLKFTVLSQTQGAAVRDLRPARERRAKKEAGWVDVSGGRIDPREPYRVFWGPGARDCLDVFFYDGPVSRAIAFEHLLRDGGALLARIEQAFGLPKPDGGPRLVNLATDGESYGHHFQFGDMAIAWLFNHLEESQGGDDPITLTNYGQYLAMFPPAKEARIFENSSWSCAHGVERWRSDCGCNTGGGGGKWNQKWRAPLREGLDWLGGQLAATFGKEAAPLLRDPWAARDDYIDVVAADYAEKAQEAFCRKHGAEGLSAGGRAKAFALLESQLMAMYMFTSCAWFFDDISGLEPVQNLRYALRGLKLAQPWATVDLEKGLLKYLRRAVPNDPAYKTGRDVWNKLVKPDRLGGRLLAAHWAAAELMGAPGPLGFFSVPRFGRGQVARLALGPLVALAAVVALFDRRTGETVMYQTLALSSDATHVAILVAETASPALPGPLASEEALAAALNPGGGQPANLEVWEAMTRLMPAGSSQFALADLLPHFRALLLNAKVREVREKLRDYTADLFHEHHGLLMMHRTASGRPGWVETFMFRVMAETEIRRLLAPARHGKPVNLKALATALGRRGLVGLVKDEAAFGGRGGEFLEGYLDELAAGGPKWLLGEIKGLLAIAAGEGFHPDLWRCQNKWHDLQGDPAFMAGLNDGEKAAMAEIGQALGFAAREGQCGA